MVIGFRNISLFDVHNILLNLCAEMRVFWEIFVKENFGSVLVKH